MRVTKVESHLLHLPLDRPITSPKSNDRWGKVDHVYMLIVFLDTDADQRGLGYAFAFQGGGRAMKVIADDDLGPLLIGEDPLDHERLGNKVYWRLQSVGRLGLVSQVYSAVDLALWDLKGKAAGLPLYKLLGGARESAQVYGSDVGWLWMSAEEIAAAARPYLDQGMMGIKVKIGHPNPETDAERLTGIRESLGEDIWLGVDANQRYDYATALSMGRFLEEDIGPDWFEEPLSCEDVDGHARLKDRLELPIALGETLFGRNEFAAYLDRDTVDVVMPDITRVGGLTNWLKIAAMAEAKNRVVSPHLFPEIAVHLACGLNNVISVEYMPWFYPAFVEVPAIKDGRMVPPQRPGLGLEVRAESLERFRVNA